MTTLQTVPIECPKCSGTGKVSLDAVHAQTLAAITTKTNTADKLAKKLDCKHTTMHERLRKLEALGFIVSRLYGGRYEYFIKEN